MRFLLFFQLLLLSQLLPAQEVGQGAPSGIDQQFINAFFRRGFNALVVTPPLGAVRRFGPTGYVQEFSGAANRAATFALVKPSASLATGPDGFDIYQVYPAVYSFYSNVGVTTAGYPTMDTAQCSITPNSAGSICTYQLFDRNYALFAYTSSLTGANTTGTFSIKDPFYTRWTQSGSISGIGPPTSAEADYTAASGVTSRNQQYQNGALYSITSGAHNGKLYAVMGKVFALYSIFGLHSGSLGLPTSDELNAGGGRIRQTFEGGAVEYTATTDAVIRPLVAAVNLNISTTAVTRMNLGESIVVRASVVASVGGELTDRDVGWITSNSRVVAIQANGPQATLRAVGGGTAIIQAVSDGKLSAPLTIFVAAPCCQIGEGAPTTSIQQSFLDAATRLRLNVKLPASNPVRRAGLGHVQELEAADSNARYLLCRSDRSPGVFLVTGDLLIAYEAAGGPAGLLAYPTADATATGRQNFEGGALAGRPVQVVTDPIRRKWEEFGYETGVLGPPEGAARSFLSFTGTTGIAQLFHGGLLFKVNTGPFANTPVLLVRAPILTRYFALGGPQGNLGFPFTNEYLHNGLPVQDFEGGQLRNAEGEVDLEERERRPEISVTPTRVTSGGRVRVIIGGFRAGARLRVAFTGLAGTPPFEIATEQGSYSWEWPVPSTTASSAVTVTATEVDSEARATTTFTITALAEAAVQLVKLRGDTQTGLPGARLLLPVVAQLRDDQGAPLPGIAVRFTPSPGAAILDAFEATDERGEAQAFVRLPGADGVALINVEAAGKVATFSARIASSSLPGFPRQMQTGSFTLGDSGVPSSQKGTLLAAASSILRYHQNRSELPASQGLSDPAILNEFLKTFCAFDSGGGRICDGFLTPAGRSEPVVNLWRLKEFVANSVDVAVLGPDETQIRDILAQGSPILLALSLTSGQAAAGTHFVVGVGVAADGEILIHDPSAVLNRSRLADYTGGFTLSGRPFKAVVMDAVRFFVRQPSPRPFLVASANASISVRTEAGECGRGVAWPNAAVVAADGSAGPVSGAAYLYYCEGLRANHVVQFTAQGAYQASLTDMGSPVNRSEISGSGSEVHSVSRPGSQWTAGPVELKIAASDVVNAATFTSDIAPGSLVSLFGSGLAAPRSETAVSVAGLPARIVSAQDFRLNFEMPHSVPAGEQSIRVESPFGILEVRVLVKETAPAIFSDERTRLPLIVNAGGRPNSVTNPVARGGTVTIYATGLGAVRQQGNNQIVVTAVRGLVQGQEVAASFAGLLAGFPGLYQVNLAVPQSVAPGLTVPLALRQAGAESNAVGLAVR
jgi:uncharacterized protein (TIGR03437 family)